MNKINSGRTHISLTNSSIIVDEDYRSVIDLLTKAWSRRKDNQLHFDGRPMLVSAGNIEVIRKVDGD